MELLPQQRARVLNPAYHLGDALGGVAVPVGIAGPAIFTRAESFPDHCLNMLANIRGISRVAALGRDAAKRATFLAVSQVDHWRSETRCLVEPRRRVPDQHVAPPQQGVEHLRLDVVVID